MTEAIVTTEQLTKRYGDQLAVDHVEMTVRRGEVYGFLGPNGAGKTTTLRMILGLIRPTGGTATVLGRPAGRPDVTERVGGLIEGPGFYPWASGRDNLLMMARYRGLSATAVDDALARVELTHRARDRFRSYSLGMKQRLGVACALMGDPELIVLDEPGNGLDPAGIADMNALVRDLAAAGHTVLLSSHQLDEVQQVCDRVGVIVAGRLVRECTVAELRGTGTLRIRTGSIDRARQSLAGLIGPEHLHRDGDRLHADVAPDRAPELARRLIADQIDVWEITPIERSLTDVFMELTGRDLNDHTNEPEAVR